MIGTGWKNCEYRTYVFDKSSKDAIKRAAIVETNTSVQRRFPSGYHQRLNSAEQHELRLAAEKSWAADGYIVLHEAGDDDAAVSVDGGEHETRQ